MQRHKEDENDAGSRQSFRYSTLLREDDDEQTTLDCDAIFEENFLKQSFKKFSSKIARKDEWWKLVKTTETMIKEYSVRLSELLSKA